MSSDTQQLIDQLWDFDAPAVSEARFSEAIRSSNDPATRLELQTQKARALGLQGRFEEAHRTLDDVEHFIASHQNAAKSHTKDVATARVRLQLERGRVFNSSGSRERAFPLFQQAFELATQIADDHLAIDAAHMIAIVHGAENRHDEALAWYRRALQLAESSARARARQWRGSLHNNIGWTLHDRVDFDAALAHFERALQCRLEQDNLRDVQIAKWCVARCLRSLRRTTEALEMQMALAIEAPLDSYVQEELGECLVELDRPIDAVPCFHRAFELLSNDSQLAHDQPDRLEQLKRKANMNG